MERLKGKVAIVTGAAGGIGAAVAEAIGREGGAVVASDLDAAGLERAVGPLDEQGLAIEALPADVRDDVSVAQLVEHTLGRHGRLDVVVNNAGVYGEPADLDAASIPVAVWDEIMSVNLRGTMLVCQRAVGAMLQSGGGSIVNISSVGSLFGDFAGVAYGSSKGGVNALTRYVATAYGKAGIRCNAVLPAMIETPKLMAALPPGMAELASASHLTPFVGQPSDVAHAVVFLASDEARFVTGSMLVLDGGYTAHSPTYAQVSGLLAAATG